MERIYEHIQHFVEMTSLGFQTMVESAARNVEVATRKVETTAHNAKVATRDAETAA